MTEHNAAKKYSWLVLTPALDGSGSYKIGLTRWPSAWHRFWVHLLLGFSYTQTSSPI